MKEFFIVLRRPLFFVVINFFFVNTLFSLLPFTLGNIVYNAGRIGIIFYAGWIVRSKGTGGAWQAALAGAVVYFADHVLLKGSVFLLNYLFKQGGMGLSAVGGVLVSFVVFTPLAMLIAAGGGFLASRKEKTMPD